MAEHTVQVLLDVELPVSFVEHLFRQHVLSTLGVGGNGHTNGHVSPPEKEIAAPAPASSAGAP